MASPVKNVSVFYSHSASNIGDIAINRGAQALIERAFPGCQMNFVSLPTGNPKFHDVMRASFLPSDHLHHSAFSKSSDKIFDYVSDTDAFLEECGARNADLVLVNSGEHLFSYDSADNADSLFWRTLPIYAAKRAGKSAAILPSTFGPFRTTHSKNLVRSIVSLADAAPAREPQSLRMQSELLGRTINPVLPDPAFFISPQYVPTQVNATPLRLGVSMRLETWGIRLGATDRSSQKALAKSGKTSLAEAFSIRICQSFLARAGREVVLFVQTDADADLAEAILDALSPEQQSAIRIQRPQSIDDYCEQLGGIDYLVTSRFHAIILGTLMGRPSTGVYFESHGHKIPGLVEMYPALGNAFNVTALDAERTAQLVMEEIEAAAGFRPALKPALEQSRQEAVAWLQGCGNKTADPALLLQAATSLAYYGNQVREAALKKEADAAVKDVVDLKKKEQDALVNRLSGSAAKLEKATEALSARENRIVEKLDVALKASAATSKLKTENEHLAAAKAELEQKLTQLTRHYDQQAKSLAAAGEQIADLTERRAELESAQLQAAERLEHLQQELGEKADLVHELESAQLQAAERLEHLQQELGEKAEMIHVLESAQLQAAERLEHLRQELDDKSGMVHALESERLQATDRLAHLEQELSGKVDLIGKLESLQLQAKEDISRLHSDLAGKDNRVLGLESAVRDMAGVSKGLLKQAAGTVQTSLQYKVGQELLKAIKRPYRVGILPVNLWRIRSNHVRKTKAGQYQKLADLEARLMLEAAKSDALFRTSEEINKSRNRALLRTAFWSALKAKDQDKCIRIAARLELLQKEKFLETEEEYLVRFRAFIDDFLVTIEDIESCNNRMTLRAHFWAQKKQDNFEVAGKVLERLIHLQDGETLELEQKYIDRMFDVFPQEYFNMNVSDLVNRQLLKRYFWKMKKSRDFVSMRRVVDRLKQLQEMEPIKTEQAHIDKLSAAVAAEIPLLDLADEAPVEQIIPRKDTVCYFLHNSLPYSSGGYATRAHGLATALTARGYKVTAVTRPGFPMDAKPDLDAASVVKEEEIDGVTYRRLMQPNKTGIKIATYLSRSVDKITALLKRLRPEVVIAASNFHTGLPALIAARRLGIPFIYEVRGFWEVTRASRDPSFVNHTSYAFQSFMEAELCRRADAVLTLTRGMKAELIERSVPGGAITLAPNACDPDQFLPRDRSLELSERLGIPAGVPVIGYIGSFVQYEGLDDLASACALLKQRGIEFRLLIVGNENVSGGELGPIAMSIKEIAEGGGFADWLIMPGRVPHEEVPDYYSLIDVAPFPRKPQPVTEMVSPMKPLEAMAMKKAVLVSSVDALAEMMRGGETGVVFEKGNVEDLAKRLAELIADPELRSRLGDAGRRWVETDRTWNATAKIVADTINAFKFARIENDLRTIEDLIPAKNMLAYTPDSGRVLYVLHNSMPHASGGYATRGHGLAKGLLDNGFSVSCFTRPGFPVDTNKKFSDMEIAPEIDIDGVLYRNDQSLRRGSVSDIEYIKHAADVYEAEIRRLRPAYVQAASFATWTGIPALIAARRTGTPFAYEVRGLAEITNMSRTDNYAATPEYKWLASLEAIACKHADHVFTLTGAMKDELATRDIGSSTITLLPNSCNVDNFHPMEREASLADRLGIENEDMVIGYIGTFVDYEGLDDLAAACVHLKQRGVKFKLLMVGSENVQNKEVGPIATLIRKIVAEGGIEDHVIMPGRVPHEEVHGYYSLIDIAAFPRKPLPVTELVSPMKPLEAMAMEKAVLVSGVGALAEMVQDGETGVVFEKGSITDLADKLEWLSGDVELRRRIGKNSRQWVQDNRTWKATAGILAAQIRAMI